MSSDHDQDGPGGGPAGPAVADRASHLSFVAHEVRNPLSTALWTAELLARLPAVDRAGPRGEKLATICLRSVSRVRLLVEDHLLCERLDAGGYPVRVEAVPIQEVLGAIQGRWPEGPATLTLALGEGLAARADRALLERALDGLTAAAAAGDAPVQVEATARGGRLEVLVTGAPPGPLADPGRGAPSEQRGRALSLSMAVRVARALGGALEVAGEGYLLSIPLA